MAFELFVDLFDSSTSSITAVDNLVDNLISGIDFDDLVETPSSTISSSSAASFVVDRRVGLRTTGAGG